MTYRIWFQIVILLVITLVMAAIADAGIWWLAGLGLGTIAALLMCRQSVAVPLRAVENGVYLLREQDFGSHLCHTGQSDADRVVEMFNTMMDTMKAERLKLQEQHYLLTKLIEASPTGIAICDFDGDIIMQNHAFETLLIPAHKEVIQQLEMDESIVVRTDFNQIVRCSCHWFMDAGFRRRFYLIERLTDEIVLAERRVLGQVIRSVGHEVNNTLGSVVSVLDTLAMLHASEADVSATLESCSDRCMHLAEFVRSYSELVKLPAPEKSSVRLDESIEHMIPFLRSMVPQYVTISLKTDDACNRTVLADMMQIERVMVNIVKNAAESIGERSDGRIDIEVSDGRTVRVTDNGHGISPEVASNLFTPFFSTKHTDRGLGLMLVADILRQHSAQFSLATNPYTRLTTFSFTL